MMLGMPFLIAILPGFLVIFLTWWLKKRNLSLFARLLPSILTVCTAFVLFYIGFVEVRGFEGAAYGIIAFFLLCFSVWGSVIATEKSRVQQG